MQFLNVPPHCVQLNACGICTQACYITACEPVSPCSRLSEEMRQPDGTRLPCGAGWGERGPPQTSTEAALPPPGSLQKTSLLIQMASPLSQVEDCKLGKNIFSAASLVKKHQQQGNKHTEQKLFIYSPLTFYSKWICSQTGRFLCVCVCVRSGTKLQTGTHSCVGGFASTASKQDK